MTECAGGRVRRTTILKEESGEGEKAFSAVLIYAKENKFI